MAKAKKSFTRSIEHLVADAERPPSVLSGDDLFNGIEIEGEDLLVTAVDTVSDRTVEPTRPDVVQVISDVVGDALPEVVGQESTVNPDFIRRVEELQKKYPEKPLAEIESMANSGGFQQGTSQSAASASFGGSAFDSGQPLGDTISQPLDAESNKIGAEELVEWYDMLQQLLSVFGYEYFSSPKEAIAATESLYPKIANNSASPADRLLYEKAQEVLVGYTRRKTKFSETVAMSQSLKERTIRLLEKILELRGIQLSPELLLGMLLLTPLVVNGGRILLEKMGFGNADEMVGKYSAFVGSQENKFWQNSNT